MRVSFWKSLAVGATLLVAGVGLYLLVAWGHVARPRLIRRMGVALWDGPQGVAFGIDERGQVESVKVFLPGRFEVEEHNGKTVLVEHLPAPDAPTADEARAPRPGPEEIVPGVGCCGVKLGDDRDAVESALGPPFTRRGWPTDETWHYKGLALSLCRGRVVAVVASRAGPRTPEGVGVGSTVQEARGAYAGLKGGFGAAAMLKERLDPRQLVAQVIGTAWWGLLASVCACVLLGLTERGSAATA